MNELLEIYYTDLYRVLVPGATSLIGDGLLIILGANFGCCLSSNWCLATMDASGKR